MNKGGYLQYFWNQAELWQIILSVVGGLIVGVIYFKSMQWSINHLSEYKHKFIAYVIVALFRIILFFVSLVLITRNNIALVIIYVISFYIAKMIILYNVKEKMHYGDVKQDDK